MDSSKEQSSEVVEQLKDKNGAVKISERSSPPFDPEGNPEEPQGTSSLPGDDESLQPSKQELRTSDVYQIRNKIPKRFDHPDWFEGYGNKSKNPVYRTTSSEHGSRPLTVHVMPTRFNGRSQKFTGRLGPHGMYRNHSLNTELDKSRV